MTDDRSAALATFAPGQLDAWLRTYLGRQAVVAVLAPAGGDECGTEPLAHALAEYTELRVLRPRAASAHDLLAEILPFDPDALVVCSTADEPDIWPGAVVDALDALGARDRCVLLLWGAMATRAAAHHQGYEDAFSPAMPIGALAAALALAAVTIEEQRRRGSSPPCYLE